MGLYSNKYKKGVDKWMNISVTVQISLSDGEELLTTKKGSDPFRGWLTNDEVEEIIKNDYRIPIAKGS